MGMTSTNGIAGEGRDDNDRATSERVKAHFVVELPCQTLPASSSIAPRLEAPMERKTESDNLARGERRTTRSESILVEIRAAEGGADAKLLVLDQLAAYSRAAVRRGL
jgi:hypothetical protein